MTEGVTTDSPEIAAWCASIIGAPLGDVQAAAALGGATTRVVVLNGTPLILTQDLKPHRLNLAVHRDEGDGVTRVVAVRGWG